MNLELLQILPPGWNPLRRQGNHHRHPLSFGKPCKRCERTEFLRRCSKPKESRKCGSHLPLINLVHSHTAPCQKWELLLEGSPVFLLKMVMFRLAIFTYESLETLQIPKSPTLGKHPAATLKAWSCSDILESWRDSWKSLHPQNRMGLRILFHTEKRNRLRISESQTKHDGRYVYNHFFLKAICYNSLASLKVGMRQTRGEKFRVATVYQRGKSYHPPTKSLPILKPVWW